VIEELARFVGLKPTTLLQVGWTAIVIAFYWFAHERIPRWIGRRIEGTAARYSAVRAATYALGIVTIIALVRIWLTTGVGLATYLGIVSAGLAVALGEPIANLAGWLFIVTRRPFIVGDRVAINDHAGDVIDIRLFQFHLLEIGNWVKADAPTGRVIEVPNGWVFRQSIANWDRGPPFIWLEVPCAVTFESNWRKAKQLLHQIADKNMLRLDAVEEKIREERGMITTQTLMSSVWTSVADHGIVLTMRLAAKPKMRRFTESQIWEDILAAFEQCNDIDFAYPTQRLFRNDLEGKVVLAPVSTHESSSIHVKANALDHRRLGPEEDTPLGARVSRASAVVSPIVPQTVPPTAPAVAPIAPPIAPIVQSSIPPGLTPAALDDATEKTNIGSAVPPPPRIPSLKGGSDPR
jgi:small-conductance mechanosensitive channel